MRRAQAARRAAGNHAAANGSGDAGAESRSPSGGRARPQARHKRLPHANGHGHPARAASRNASPGGPRGHEHHASGGSSGSATAHSNGAHGDGAGADGAVHSRPRAMPPTKLSRKARGMVANPSTISWSHNPMNSTLKRQQRAGDVLLPQHMGIPVRDMLQATFKLFRDASIVDALVFAVYFSLFLGILYMAFDVHLAFTTDDATIDLFLDEEFDDQPYKANFYEVMTHEEFWIWMRGPLVNGLYPDEWYNGDPFGRAELGYLDFHLRLVGGAQLRQLRVANDSCAERRFTHMTAVHNGTELGKYDSRDGTCFDFFSTEVADTAPFGPSSAPSKYKHSADLSPMFGLYTFGPYYGTGGYVVELPTNGAAGRALVDELFADKWTDRGTRAVAISFNLYNTNTRLLTVVRVLFEFFPNGHMVKSAKTFTVKMAMYQAGWDLVRLAMEVLYVCFFFYYIGRQLYELRWHNDKLVFFMRFTNIYNVLLIAANGMFIFNWISYAVSRDRHDFDVNAETYTDMFVTAELFIMTYTWAALVGLMGFLKIFQFLGISKNMNALWMTLARAAPDLATFLVGFLLVSAGFAYTANLLFGAYLPEYHKMASALNTLLRVPLGDMDYAALAQARPSLAPFFFTLYVIMVALIILNMFIGIITKYFDDVHAEIKQQDFWKGSTLSWEGERMMQLRTFYLYWGTKLGCFAWCGGRRGSQLDARETATRLARHTSARQRYKAFMEAMQQAARVAKRTNNIIMYEYFERLYKDSGDQNVYICVNEICAICRDTPCGNHTDCEARKLVAAYQRMQLTMLVGATKKFVPITSEAAMTYQTFEVLKFSSSGLAVPRRMSVNTETGMLMNFSRSMRLIARLPLSHLITLEMDKCDLRRLILMFSSSSGRSEQDRAAAERKYGVLDTTYDVLFEDALNRHMFVSRALEAHALANGKDAAEGVRVLGEEGGGGAQSASDRQNSERQRFISFMENQGSSRKLLETGSDSGSGKGFGRASDDGDEDIVETGTGAGRDTRRLQTVEELRRAVRALTDRLGQTAVQRSLNLNSADMALLGSLQQELARARRSLKQADRQITRRASLLSQGSQVHLPSL